MADPDDDQAVEAVPIDDAPHVDELAGDATALCRTVAYRDLPDGFVVIPARLAPGHLGLSWGTGHALAAAHGEVMGRPGVLLNVPDCLWVGGPAAVDVTALHELAHMLFQTADIGPREAATAGDVDVPAGSRAADAARSHHPGWAGALALLGVRAATFRPRRAAALLEVLGHQLAKYGYPAAGELLEVLGPVPDDMPIRAALGWGAVGLRRLFEAMPDDDRRAAVIAGTGEYRA